LATSACGQHRHCERRSRAAIQLPLWIASLRSQ
jgi:hypothetical protein